ncbi:MAG: hypothetical protein HQM08_30970, partial [Candidatus Riflebacteria bacterium]|nr:hypothetical protein [Candidatus Riflebacteria bacterium]
IFLPERKKAYKGTQGTWICKIFDYAAAQTGLSEKSLKRKNRAATLAKGCNGDVYTFDTSCIKLTYDGSDSVFSIKSKFEKDMRGGGTSFESIFRTLDRSYARVFVISDMQGADNLIGRGSAYEAYKSKYGCDPYIYSVDLAGHGTDMFKQKGKLFYLAGYSNQIFETAKKYETDYNALLEEVRKIEI